jgi:MFS family permease
MLGSSYAICPFIDLKMLFKYFVQESVFFAAEALSVLQWGRVSDRIGRKPPLVFGTLGLAVAIASFGLSKQFWSLVVSRCVQGIFNGNIGITKAVMTEIADESNIAQSMSAYIFFHIGMSMLITLPSKVFGLIPFQWGIGVTFG